MTASPEEDEGLTQLQVAEAQLERSIQLFLDEGDYFSSATLAGAAEEIFGNLIREKGEIPSLDSFVTAMSSLLTDKEIRAIAPESKKSHRGIIASELNQYRNWLKHYMKDEFVSYIDPKEAAESLIDRACTNYWQLMIKETKLTKRFLAYQQHRDA